MCAANVKRGMRHAYLHLNLKGDHQLVKLEPLDPSEYVISIATLLYPQGCNVTIILCTYSV